MTALFSLLMANYNNSHYIEGAIDSVFKQTYTNWEIIIVDDASTDEFEHIITRYQHESRIKVYRNEKNMGCSYTKRVLAEKASGSLLAYLDPDDTITPDAVMLMVQAHKENPNASIVNSKQYICDENMKILRVGEHTRALPPKTPYLLLSDGSIHAFAAFKRSSYDRTKGLEPVRKKDRAIDQELYYLLEEEGEVYFIDKPLYYYRIHSGSISNWGNEVAANIEHYNIIEESCIRRIKKLKSQKSTDYRYWIKKYRTRYYKVRILNSFRKKDWKTFIESMLIFPFAGGMANIVSYAKKMPAEGISQIKKTLFGSYKAIQ